MLSNYNFVKIEWSSGLKSMLLKEFREIIVFHNRAHKNQSTMLLDASKGDRISNIKWSYTPKCHQNDSRENKEL